MKKLAVILMSSVIAACSIGVIPASGEDNVISFKTESALYAHAAVGSSDTEAWTVWQCAHDDDLTNVNVNNKYFFLPSGADDSSVEIYNASASDAALNDIVIHSGEKVVISYETDKQYTASINGESFTVTFMHSTAEAAIYVNNTDADGKGTDLITYLSPDKSISAKATGAIVESSGNIDNTAIKKIKGRGNTT